MNEIECTFCKIQKTEDIIWKGKHFFIIFDNVPVNPGHTLIIPLKHKISLLDLSKSEWSELYNSIREAHKIINNTDLEKLYTDMLTKSSSIKNSDKFIGDALKNLRNTHEIKGFNYGVNEVIAAGRTVHHLHWHVIPRYEGDVEDPVGGVRSVIPGRANYKI